MTNTTVNLDASRHIISLASSGMLAIFECHSYTGAKSNQEESAKLTQAAKAASNAAKVQQYLFAHSPELHAINKKKQFIYNWSKRVGYDWASNIRYIPQTLFLKVLNEFTPHQLEFYQMVELFLAKVDDLVTAAAFTQGDMFNRNDYPTAAQLRPKFSCDLIPMDVPVGDFRNALFAECAEDLQKHYEKQASRLVNGLMDDAARRLIEIAERLSNACTEVDKTKVDADGKAPRAKKISESTVTGAKEIVATLRCINVTGNADLETACCSLERAMKDVTANDLKESAYVRSQVKDEVDDMLSKFKPLNAHLL